MMADLPKTAKAAVLVAPGKFEIKEFPIPEINDDEMIVKVEGCGVCGTDGHEYKRDPFGICPTVLGPEGTGTIVKMAKNLIFEILKIQSTRLAVSQEMTGW